MLDVRVVLGRVCGYVVNIMVALPPTYGEAAQKVRDEYANASIGVKVVGDAKMAGVMYRKSQQVPQEAETDTRQGKV